VSLIPDKGRFGSLDGLVGFDVDAITDHQH
jgi:hypothetical protein